MTKVIAGLGNPGVEYENTPHSIGFEVVDAIAAKIGVSWEEKRHFKCMLARGVFGGANVILVKPLTFMNLSGTSIAPVVKYCNSSAADLVVVHDDIDLPVGRIRVRKNGSCGGHNGIRNIIERLGTQEFARLRIGVGKNRDNVIGYVLGKFSPAIRPIMNLVVSKSVDVVETMVSAGPDKAMNDFNGFDAANEVAP